MGPIAEMTSDPDGYTEGFVSACNSIQSLLVDMREKLHDEESSKLLDKVLSQIFQMKQEAIK